MNAEFWSGKKVLITGHTGFKGSWLSLWLQQLGAEVTGFSIGTPTTPCLFDVASVGDGMESVIADIRDLTSIKQCVQDSAPDIIVHMAAQSLVRPSYVDPVETYSTNVMGTVNLLEAARHCDSVRVVLIVTSDKCYENREWHWGYRENEALGGHDPYSSSKGCAELVTATYRSSFFHNTSDAAVASVRAGNVIGGGDWAEDRIVPDVIKALQSGLAANVRNPVAVRPWQFVLEPLHGYMLLAEQLWLNKVKYAGAWNFGPADGTATSVGNLVGELARIWGGDVARHHYNAAQPHEATWLKLDSSKARQVLGWNPVQALSTTLQYTVEWYRQYAEFGNAREKTLEQIKLYQEALPV